MAEWRFLYGAVSIMLSIALIFIILKVYNAVDSPQEYYDNLAIECESNEFSDCCISSVTVMRTNNYELAENNTCPRGMQLNSIKCPGSYKWCQPGLVII